MRTLALLILLAGCAPEGGTLSMTFSRKTLYDAPYPSDDLLSASGVPDLSLIPNPNKVDLIVQGMKMLAADARGFSRAGHIYFRADQELDPTTFPDAAGSLKEDASIFLMALDDQKRTPVECGFFTDGGAHGDKNLLSVLPVQGLPMRAKTRYVAVVTSRVKDKLGRALRPSPAMQSILDGQRPTGLRAEVADAYVAAAKLVKAKNPVGQGGWITFSRSQRQSSPAFTVWRPFSHVSESATWVTLVLKSEAVVVGDPICWYPLAANVGNVLGNFAFDGIPGMSSSAPAGEDSETALRWTDRRVSPMRSSFNRFVENMCW